MQKEIELKCLCDGLLDALREMGLGKYSLRNYYYEGMWPLIKAYRKAGKELYDPVFTNEVVLDIQKQFQEGLVGNHISMHIRKMAALMEEYSLNRCIVWHRIKPCPAIQLSAYYEYIILGFKSWEEERKVRTPKGIQSFVGIARKFFRYLEMNGHSSPKTITLKLVSGFLLFVAPQHKGSMERVLSALKNLCEYLLGCIDCIDFRPALTARPSQRKKLMPVFSTQEVVAITESAMKYSSLSKRDTAVFAIAQSVGLRAINIVNLKLVNINWNSHEIRFCQHKTGVELVLPLEPAVGNAIADYILNERPKAQSEFLFVRARFPYGAMTSNAVGDRLRLHMRKAEMNYAPGCHKGFHSFRRYVATQMIDGGVPIDTVKEILGHTQIDSMKPYVRISKKRLLVCALDLDGIEVTQEALL